MLKHNNLKHTTFTLHARNLADTRTVRVPEVFHVGALPHGRGAFVVMEHLDLQGGGPDQAALGRAVARMHLAAPTDPNAAAGRFGFAVDNTIGATPQPNAWGDDGWVAFYRDMRLRHQLDLLGARLTGCRLLQCCAHALRGVQGQKHTGCCGVRLPASQFSRLSPPPVLSPVFLAALSPFLKQATTA